METQTEQQNEQKILKQKNELSDLVDDLAGIPVAAVAGACVGAFKSLFDPFSAIKEVVNLRDGIPGGVSNYMLHLAGQAAYCTIIYEFGKDIIQNPSESANWFPIYTNLLGAIIPALYRAIKSEKASSVDKKPKEPQ
ncbi:MAG: hypothetical protein PHH54_00730 [Candidatus Nanoarchaeia archaeon]|nr:hypothetical protein [Candidatus Nanoarchaeia archaeon]MDD5740487.1 hypothetical protein [Candidatus Nanoarchaeia archaeon]